MNRTTVNHAYVNPSDQKARSILDAVDLNNKANILSQSGDLAGAEAAHLSALRLKTEAVGPNTIQVAVTKNALGELYMTMGRVDEAQTCLEEALSIRKTVPNFDTAVTRENLGQLYEMKGDLLKAREIRTAHELDSMACGNPTCPGEMFKKSELMRCGTCKSVWYHDRSCQRQDWKARHKKYCKPMEA